GDKVAKTQRVEGAVGRGSERRRDAPVAVVGEAHLARGQVVAEAADLDRSVNCIEVREHDLATRGSTQLDDLTSKRVGDQVDPMIDLQGELLETRDADVLRDAIDL